jgi:uroporphyrinogen-III synthase
MIYLLSPLKKEGAESLPMISFTITKESIDFSTSDTLMFTSKQAVVSANSIDEKWKEYPCIAIGSATKKKIEALGGEVICSPKEFYAESLAKDIQNYFADKKLLYLRPKMVSFDSKGYLAKSGIALEEQIIYETSCISYIKKKKPIENAVVIFTSPSTIKCFFKSFEWDESYMAVLIGHATQKYLPRECKYVVADEPLITSCIKKAKEVEENRKK